MLDLSSTCQNLFLEFNKSFEVDVFEHPRFCDEFSHLMTGHFVANSTLCWRLSSIERMFELIQTFCYSVKVIIELSKSLSLV